MEKTGLTGWRLRLHEIIYEADTKAGRAFDIGLIIAILISLIVVMLESVASYRASFGGFLRQAEWIITILFTLEYLTRIICIKKPHRYIFSFYGVVDLLAILPTYLSLLFPGGQYLIVIRILRLLRVFRVLKLALYLNEGQILIRALIASFRKITVFLLSVVALVVILGSLMYMIEGSKNGFDNIPHSIYWAVVTLTTVGYGDITPQTPLGKLLSACVMILGYAIIAVPTGIMTVEFSHAMRKDNVSTQACPSCGHEGHEWDAKFCKYCGSEL